MSTPYIVLLGVACFVAGVAVGWMIDDWFIKSFKESSHGYPCRFHPTPDSIALAEKRGEIKGMLAARAMLEARLR